MLFVRCLAALAVLAASALGAHAQPVLYGADGAASQSSNLYILDPATGAVVQTVGPIGFAVTGLAVDPLTGVLYGTTGRQSDPSPGFLITIDKASGAGTVVGDLRSDTFLETAADITFTPDGVLYGWLEPTRDDLVIINRLTGAATVVGESGLGTFGSGLASSADGTLFYTGAADTGQLRTIDRITGAPVFVTFLDGDTDRPIPALAFDPSGTLYGVRLDQGTRDAELITINTGTGAITLVGLSVDGLDAIAFDVAVIPEPETYAMMLAGLGLLGFGARRRRRISGQTA